MDKEKQQQQEEWLASTLDEGIDARNSICPNGKMGWLADLHIGESPAQDNQRQTLRGVPAQPQGRNHRAAGGWEMVGDMLDWLFGIKKVVHRGYSATERQIGTIYQGWRIVERRKTARFTRWLHDNKAWEFIGERGRLGPYA